MQLEIIHNDFKPSIIFPNSNYISATQIVEGSGVSAIELSQVFSVSMILSHSISPSIYSDPAHNPTSNLFCAMPWSYLQQ